MTVEAALPLAQRWRVFLHERFPLPSYIIMTTLLALANVGIAVRVVGGHTQIPIILAGFVIALSFLFRLRCFDEIKDYRTDLQLNPQRPLPRGLLTIQQLQIAIGVLAITEMAVASSFGWAPAVTHLVAISYSFLMYREFFVGTWLRPQLTLYAITHTIASVSGMVAGCTGNRVGGLVFTSLSLSLRTCQLDAFQYF